MAYGNAYTQHPFLSVVFINDNIDDTTKARNLSFKIIDVLHNTFGYDIFVDGKLMVHQPTIPGVSGNDGFKKKADAEKVAQLVITKIRDGIMPPTVTRQEMEKLGVSLK